MSKTRIRSIDVRGFRSFGSTPQPLGFSSDVAVVWGPNSQGKTSLAEALEFLFTGSIVRRDLLASSKDEFAGTLRNVHLSDTDEVFVEVQVEHQGTTYKVRRTLLNDYAKKGNCDSKLEVDGQASSEVAFPAIGVHLSQPPLAAPVLMQHTLPYVFSAGPKERSEYFKALLDVDDLDRFLEQVEAHGVDLGAPKDAVVQQLLSCAGRPTMQSAFAPLLKEKGRSLDVHACFAEAAASLLKEAGITVPEKAEARFEAVEAALQSRQAETFPLGELGIKDLDRWQPKTIDLATAANNLKEQRSKVDAAIEQVMPLLETALKVETISRATESQQCPLCEDGTLTVKRIAAICTQLQDTREFRAAEAAARTVLSTLSRNFGSAVEDAERILPSFVKRTSRQRRAKGFDIARARRLAGDQGASVISQWLNATRSLLRARRKLHRQVEQAKQPLLTLGSNLSAFTTDQCKPLQKVADELVKVRLTFEQTVTTYKEAEQMLLAVLPSAVAKESKTEGWQDLLDLRQNAKSLKTALVEWEARSRTQQEFERALGSLKSGMGDVLDEKIGTISGDVEKWWDLLRPGEATFFSAVKRRTKATRTIDFKASISPHADRSSAETRDAVAVLSYSQLQCLGLSLFLARATREGAGFVVLDDPVLAGDEDHRPYFVHSVIPALLQAGVQVIVITQDQSMLKDMGNLFEHLGIDCFQLLRDPTTGTAINKTSDGFEAILARAQAHLDNAHPEPRKKAAELIRDAAERFCKELLVKDRRTKGDHAALISDYDGEVLHGLTTKVLPLLSKADEPGKLTWIRSNMNPGNHDAPIPSAQDVRIAFGYLKAFKKSYLT